VLNNEVVTWSQMRHENILPFLGILDNPLTYSYLLSLVMPCTLGDYVKPGVSATDPITPCGYNAAKDRKRLVRLGASCVLRIE
jgi:hypothetical protein